MKVLNREQEKVYEALYGIFVLNETPESDKLWEEAADEGIVAYDDVIDDMSYDQQLNLVRWVEKTRGVKILHLDEVDNIDVKAFTKSLANIQNDDIRKCLGLLFSLVK